MADPTLTLRAPLRAILFDFDGTLVDSEPVHLAIWQHVMAGHGHHLSPEVYQSELAGLPTLNNAHKLIARHGLQVDASTLARQKYDAMSRHLSSQAYPALPGVETLLPQLKANGVTLAIVTGAPRAHVQATLGLLGWNDWFTHVVTADDVRQTKPSPDPYLLALQLLGLCAEEAVAIEDTHTGLTAARAAGVACVAVPHALSQHQDFSQASARCANLAEAIAWATVQR